MHKQIYLYFYNKVIAIDLFLKDCFNNNFYLLTIKKIKIIIILNNMDSLENSSILSALFLLKFLGISSPKISKIYINKSKKYTVIFNEKLPLCVIFYFFLYFLNSYAKLSYLEKKSSVILHENCKFNNYCFHIKNLQMFSEIAHHFLLWKNDKVYVNVYIHKKNMLKFKNFFKSLNFSIK